MTWRKWWQEKGKETSRTRVAGPSTIPTLTLTSYMTKEEPLKHEVEPGKAVQADLPVTLILGLDPTHPTHPVLVQQVEADLTAPVLSLIHPILPIHGTALN